MNFIYDTIQLLETALMFSVFLFTVFLYQKSKDKIVERILIFELPYVLLLIITYVYNYFSKYSHTYQINIGTDFLSASYAIIVVLLLGCTILAGFNYVIGLIPINESQKKRGFYIFTIITMLLIIISISYMMISTQQDLSSAIKTAIWLYYPVASIAIFIQAVFLAFYIKKIDNENDFMLAKIFLIAFSPQIIYSILDITIFDNFYIQLSHLSYIIFGVLSFYNLFTNYSNINIKKIISDKQNLSQEDLKVKYNFSDREIEVIELLIKGKTNAQVSEELFISINTVKSHVKSIYKKLAVSNRLQLIEKINKYRNNH